MVLQECIFTVFKNYTFKKMYKIQSRCQYIYFVKNELLMFKKSMIMRITDIIEFILYINARDSII